MNWISSSWLHLKNKIDSFSFQPNVRVKRKGYKNSKQTLSLSCYVCFVFARVSLRWEKRRWAGEARAKIMYNRYNSNFSFVLFFVLKYIRLKGIQTNYQEQRAGLRSCGKSKRKNNFVFSDVRSSFGRISTSIAYERLWQAAGRQSPRDKVWKGGRRLLWLLLLSYVLPLKGLFPIGNGQK